MWNLPLLRPLFQNWVMPVILGTELTPWDPVQRGQILPLEHGRRSRLCKGTRRVGAELKYSTSQGAGSSGECPGGPRQHGRDMPSCWGCLMVLPECEDAKEWMPLGLLRAISSSITSCLPEHSLLLGQSWPTWECPLLSLPLPKVDLRLAQGIMMSRTCTPGKSPSLSREGRGTLDFYFQNHSDLKLPYALVLSSASDLHT